MWHNENPPSDVTLQQCLSLMCRCVHNGNYGTARLGATSAALPPNVHLLSLDRVRVETTAVEESERVLLRLHHIYQTGEHPTLAQVCMRGVKWGRGMGAWHGDLV